MPCHLSWSRRRHVQLCILRWHRDKIRLRSETVTLKSGLFMSTSLCHCCCSSSTNLTQRLLPLMMMEVHMCIQAYMCVHTERPPLPPLQTGQLPGMHVLPPAVQSKRMTLPSETSQPILCQVSLLVSCSHMWEQTCEKVRWRERRWFSNYFIGKAWLDVSWFWKV